MIPPPVPRLDLAPKRKRPLSLEDPRDYLLLLYWVFFFPQAVRWYVKTFWEPVAADEPIDWVRKNPIGSSLVLQGLVLVVVVPWIIGNLLQAIGIPIAFSVIWIGIIVGLVVSRLQSYDSDIEKDPVEAMAFGVLIGIVLGVVGGVAFGVGAVEMSDIANGMARSAVSGVVLGVIFGALFGIILSLFAGMSGNISNLSEDLKRGMPDILLIVIFGIKEYVFLGAFYGALHYVSANIMVQYRLGGVAGGMAGGVAEGVIYSLLLGVRISVASIVTVSVVKFRPDGWLIRLLAVSSGNQEQFGWLPRNAFLPVPWLSNRLSRWLRQDWETGLYNANQLMTYTLQLIPVVRAVNRVLAELPAEQVLFRVAQLADTSQALRLVYFASASIYKYMKLEFIRNFWWMGSRRKPLLRLDTPARSAAAGFWYLSQGMPQDAAVAFESVRSLLYGSEMASLAQALARFAAATDLETIAAQSVVPIPSTPRLRPTSWEAIAALNRALEDAQRVQHSLSRVTRSLSLTNALSDLKDLLSQAKRLPQAEKELILNIARTWQEALLRVAPDVGQMAIDKPIANPYVVGDPVEGRLFVGRQDILRQLKALWVTGHQLPSVVLYGHRRMGKTSILRNVSRLLGSEIELAYVNLQRVGSAPQGVGEVLLAIGDAIAEAVELPPPDTEDLLQLPYPTFQRYLRRVERERLQGRSTQGLIIALDEFEQIEMLIERGRIDPDFMGMLRGQTHESRRIAFALAGLHTLEEMTENYFHPFYASIHSIQISFLTEGETSQLLANPHETFLLDYQPAALERIYALTAGQPYLVQLVGFQLVRRYNDQVFKRGRRREALLSLADVEAVVGDPEFFRQGRYYFTGVWDQARQGAGGQQAVLRALAPHPSGLRIEALGQAVELEVGVLREALEMLARHDVVWEVGGQWQIRVELFRRWVVERQGSY